MADPLFDEINLVTLKEIYPQVIEDQYFLDAPFLAYIRDHCMVPWTGGAYSQITFRYKPMIGGFYQRGASWNINKRATLAGAVFEPKFLEFAIPEYKEDLKVFNKGPLAVFKLIDEDLRNGMDSASALTAIAMSRHGMPIMTGVTDNRVGKLNGWVEAMNDGVTNGWDGNYFTTYGGATRNGVLGSVLNSVPVFCGNAAGGAGPISYNLLEEAYQDSCVGKEAPNLMVSNKAGIAYVKERMQVQQIFQQEKDPIWGVMGFRFNNAMVLKDDYFPSSKYGTNDPDLGNYLAATFTSSATPAAASNLPASQTITVGEVIAMFNTKKWIFRVADDDEYGYGFTGWYPAQDNSKVVGHIKAAVMLECTAPRLQKQLYGING